MKRLITSILITASIATTAFSVQADDDDDHYKYRPYKSPYSTQYNNTNTYNNDVFYDQARVIDVRPIIEHVSLPPQEHCWDEQVSYSSRGQSHRDGFPAHAVLGGIIGGAIGNQIGAGKGKDAATIVGALTGIALGNDSYQRNHKPTARAQRVTERRCRVSQNVRSREKITGYRVTYRYHGRDFVTQTQYRPGPRIQVSVAVNPID